MQNKWHIYIAVGAVLTLVFVLSLGAIDDFDVWWHLACGEWLVKNHSVPHTIIFSYTAPDSRWVNGFILPELSLYAAWSFFGSAGVVLWGAIVATGTLALAIAMSRRGAGFRLACAALLPAAMLARGFIEPRPALLSPAFLLLTLWLLEDHRLRGGRLVLWLIPLTALWANSHPMFFLGPMFTGAYIAAPMVMAMFSEAQRPKEKWLKYVTYLTLVLGLQLCATLANPYGPDIYLNILTRAGQGQFSAGNLEMKPLFTGGGLLWGTMPCFLIVTGMCVAAFLWAGRRAKLEHIFLFVFTAALAVVYRRNVINYAFLSLPLMSWAVTDASRGAGIISDRLRARILQAGSFIITAISLFLIWFVATDRLYVYTNTLRSTGLGIQSAFFPDQAVKLLKDEDIKGNLFHTFDLGGYLIFNLYPKFKVFIDGRNLGYPLQIAELSQRALRSEDVFNVVKQRYGITAILLPLNDRGAWPMMTELIKSQTWAVVRADGAGILFLERGAGNDAVISRREINLLATLPNLAPPQSGRGLGFFDSAENPTGNIWWALIYGRLNRPDMAARVLEPALSARPLKKGMQSWLGDLELSSGDYANAAKHYRGELENAPDDFKLWVKLGAALETTDPSGARDAYNRALKLMKNSSASADDIKRLEEYINKINQ